MGTIYNIDLLSVGTAIAAIGTLGFIVFFNNRKSVTNKTFLIFALTAILWSIFNYLNYQFNSPVLVLWLLRFVMFTAVWYCFFLFQLFYVFPDEKITFSRKYKFILIPAVAVVSALSLSPAVLSSINELAQAGQVSKIHVGWGIFVFGITVVSLIFTGLFKLFKKSFSANKSERLPFRLILIGTFITFALHLAFNFIFPAFLNIQRYIPLGALFTFPFVAFTSYAIIKHRVFHIKVVTTGILTFILAIVSLTEIVLANDISTIIFRSGVFVLVLSFGILLNKSVLREVEQREKLEVLTKELGMANEKLKELDKLKSQFLSFASHQVKAPMNVVKGYATLIYDGTYGPVSDKIKETAIKIKDSADRMVALVNNIMDLRKIEEGKMEYKFEEANIGNMVADLVGEFRMLAENKKLRMEFTKPEKILMANIDIQKVRQSVQNLVENAIKYTDTGWIKVSIEESANNSILITVANSGHPIPKDLLPHLFNEYQRDSATASKIEGTGLGLFIAKQIITANHGEIWAESEEEGSKFFIKLPRSMTG